MNQKIKISQLPAKGSNLAAADLLEIAEFTGTGYISKSITGQEIIDAIPAPSVDWGDIGGTLSDQTDLNTALSGKVPTSRTLTINGTTQDLSADRTFTISTGITIGTTAITSGTVGRVLFEGTGNVVQQSSSLFWDNTNGRLGIGTSSPAFKADIIGTGRINNLTIGDGTYRGTSITFVSQSGGTEKKGIFFDGGAKAYYQQTTNLLAFDSPFNGGTLALSFDGNTNNVNFYNTSGTILSKIFANTGNWAINTTTDAGFRLDVNGTARVQGALTTSAGIISNGTVRVTATTASPSGNASFFVFDGAEGTNFAYDYGTATYRALAYNGSLVRFLTGGTERARFAITTGNFLINTTTDAGFRLDVNGTARVKGSGTTSSTTSFTVQNSAGSTNLQILDNGAVQVINEGNFSVTRYGNTLLSTSQATSTLNTYNSQVTVTNTQISFNTLGNLGWQFAQDLFQGYHPMIIQDAAYKVRASSAIMELNSKTRGFLPPVMTTAQKNAIASPATGLQVYDTTLNRPCFYDGTTWITL